jgi:hypothetical protein
LKQTNHPSSNDKKPYQEECAKTQKSVLYPAIPFVGLDKVCQKQTVKRIRLCKGPCQPSVDIHKSRVWGRPRTPLLDKPLTVEGLLGGGTLPRPIMDRIERDGVGVGVVRHGSVRRRDDWLRGKMVIGEGLTAGSSPPYQSPPT